MSIPKAIIVPARLESVRFPRKLLYVVRGEPLILHTARQVQRSAPDCPLYFAVADEELAGVLEAEGFQCVLTDPSLASGTDRIAYANREIGAERVVNVQADEPLVSKSQIEMLFALLEGGAAMSTLAIPLDGLKRFKDPNQVKVVRALQGHALYFSRAPIPWDRESAGNPDPGTMGSLPVLGHLGLYGYRASFLEQFVSLPPSPLEQIERLEQLRALENGAEIQVGLTEERTVGVDTPEDVGRLEEALDALENG
ncbi:MAG: 3-deoxy-manno-octulosonate cytidylyltransferase [Puniceicoccales bacterium]